MPTVTEMFFCPCKYFSLNAAALYNVIEGKETLGKVEKPRALHVPFLISPSQLPSHFFILFSLCRALILHHSCLCHVRPIRTLFRTQEKIGNAGGFLQLLASLVIKPASCSRNDCKGHLGSRRCREGAPFAQRTRDRSQRRRRRGSRGRGSKGGAMATRSASGDSGPTANIAVAPGPPTLTQAGSTVQKAREIRCSLLRRQACGPVRPGKYAATGRSCCCCCRSFFGCSCFRRRDSLYATGCHQFFVVVIFRCASTPKPSTTFFSAGVVPGELGDTPPLFRDIPASPLRDFRVSACALSRRVPSSHHAS